METRHRVRSFDSPLPASVFRALPRVPIHVVCDNLRSAFNVGAVFRTSDAARITGVHLCGITAAPPNRKLERTALGTLDAVPWSRHASACDAIDALRADGAAIISIETAPRGISYVDADYPRPLALVVGNEALGVSAAALAASDIVVGIPMRGYKNSVNVAVAFGIVLFEIVRRWEAGGWSVAGPAMSP